jgi:LPXTG-motif cell wall-anchored protein
MTIIRMPHLTWKQRGALAAGALIFAAVGGSELAGAPAASATDAATAVTSTCVGGRWQVVMSATSQTDVLIHVRLDDTHGAGPLVELAPHATKTVTEHPDAGSDRFHWVWSTPDGILTGDAVSGTVTRPAGCGVGTTTTSTTAPVASSTTIVPTPPPTVGSTVVSSPEPTTPPASAPGTTAPRSRPPAPVAPSSIAPQHLPATGAGDVLFVIAVVGLFLLIAGVVLHRVKRSES